LPGTISRGGVEGYRTDTLRRSAGEGSLSMLRYHSGCLYDHWTGQDVHSHSEPIFLAVVEVRSGEDFGVKNHALLRVVPNSVPELVNLYIRHYQTVLQSLVKPGHAALTKVYRTWFLLRRFQSHSDRKAMLSPFREYTLQLYKGAIAKAHSKLQNSIARPGKKVHCAKSGPA